MSSEMVYNHDSVFVHEKNEGLRTRFMKLNNVFDSRSITMDRLPIS